MYIEIADLVLYFGEREIRKASNQQHAITDETQINAPVVDSAIKRACAIVNSYIAPCVQLPLPTPLPDNLCIIPHLAGDLARFILNEDDPSDEMIDRNENAIDTLQELCPAGPVLVDDNGVPLPSPATNPDYRVGNTETGRRCRVFGIDTLSRYQSEPRRGKRRFD